MFRKLVSNVSFSPALVGQLGFYAKRLKNEEATRRVGLVFTALALIVQSFVIFSPPTPANAASSSDFIPGGVSSKSEYLSNYDNNTNGLKDIFNALGITRAELASVSENHTIYDQSSDPTYYSWGHKPHFSYSEGERTYAIPRSSGGKFDIYIHPVKLWGGYSRRVMVGHSAKLGWFALMYACGNLITLNYPPIQTCPSGYTGVYPDCKAPAPKVPQPVSTPPPACQYNKNILASDSNCQPCPGDTTLWIKDSRCLPSLISSKDAINTTQDSKNAALVTANAGDKIEYHLNIKNTGIAPASANFTDDLTDVTEYASLIDAGGGTYSQDTHVLTWPQVSVQPGQTVTRIFSVQVSDPIPSVAQGVSNPLSFDCKMLNTFGNSTTINVNCPTFKQVEQITTSLPHTGANENLLFAGGLFAIVGYFYARSRQLKKEVRLIRRDINVGTI